MSGREGDDVNPVGDTAPPQILLDINTRVASIDPSLERRLGYDADELLDRPFSQLVTPLGIEAVGEALVSLVNGDVDVATIRLDLQAADLAAVDSLVTIEARTNTESGFLGFSVTTHFDTPPPPPELSLPGHLQRLPVPSAVVDGDGLVADHNRAWRQLFDAPTASTDQDDLDPASTVGTSLLDVVSTADRSVFEPMLEELLTGVTTAIRTEQRCDTGHGTVWCRISATAFDTPTPAFAVTIEDISAEHLTNRVLLSNEQLFRSLAESSPVGLARLAPDLSITYSNPSWRHLTAETSSEPNLDLASVIHENGRDRILDQVSDRIHDDSHEPVRARLAVDAGVTRWASLRVATVHDEELGVVGHVITIEDVTELVRDSESQSQLAGVVESTSDLVGIADLTDGSLLYLNSAAQELFAPDGLTEGVDIRTLYSDEEWERYRNDVYPVLRRGETWTGEVTMLRHDGQPIRVLQTIAAEIDSDGHLERASVLGRDVTHERETLDELAYKATHDHLTGLPNRSLLIDHMGLALARSARDHTPIAVLFIDLDRFKIINDTHGHDAGDRLLQEIADRMSSVLRPSDTVARLGGDEFVILCEDIDGEVDAMTIAGRVRAAIEDEPITIQGIDMTISASVGIAMSNSGSTYDPQTLLQRADTAMYRAKNSGRARTELFDDVLRSRNRRRLEMTEQLGDAIDGESLELHYQPIVDLHSGRVAGLEAFIRWPHPTEGMLRPADFLPLAIETGLVQRLDAFVIRQACRDAKRWLEVATGRAPMVHMNIDGQSLLDPQLPETLEREITANALPPAQICVELSEPFLMKNGELLSQRLTQLCEIGVAVAIDDVGTGAMVLPRLGEYSLNVLKIDPTLTAELVDSEDARQLVRGVAALGRALGLRIGAESVEHEDAVAILRSVGVEEAQGHVFSTALPADKVEPLLHLRSTLARADR